jgi:osmoprotectant transport system ATP-binding protein
MDEPFGAVDPLTRERLQAQFVRIQREVKKTVILVTHDLDEAIRLADRIAIMSAGKLVQYDTPENILSKPANKFVGPQAAVPHQHRRLHPPLTFGPDWCLAPGSEDSHWPPPVGLGGG